MQEEHEKLQEYHAETESKVLDADVLMWLSVQDQDTKHHVNEIIRHIMALKHA